MFFGVRLHCVADFLIVRPLGLLMRKKRKKKEKKSLVIILEVYLAALSFRTFVSMGAMRIRSLYPQVRIYPYHGL